MLMLQDACQILHDCIKGLCEGVHICLMENTQFLHVPDILDGPVVEGHSDIPSVLCRSLQLYSLSAGSSVRA